MRFTRKEVIEAIMQEPLESGTWISRRNVWSESVKPTADNCKVCAVGGLFRRKLASRPGMTVYRIFNTIMQYFGIEDQKYKHGGKAVGSVNSLSRARALARQQIAKGNHLAALSKLFETYARFEGVTPEMRKKLSADVEKMFPKSFSTDVKLAG